MSLGTLLLGFHTSMEWRKLAAWARGGEWLLFSPQSQKLRLYNFHGIPKKAQVRRCKGQGTSAEETVTLITMSRESAISLQPPKRPAQEGNQRSVFNLKEYWESVRSKIQLSPPSNIPRQPARKCWTRRCCPTFKTSYQNPIHSPILALKPVTVIFKKVKLSLSFRRWLQSKQLEKVQATPGAGKSSPH